MYCFSVLISSVWPTESFEDTNWAFEPITLQLGKTARDGTGLVPFPKSHFRFLWWWSIWKYKTKISIIFHLLFFIFSLQFFSVGSVFVSQEPVCAGGTTYMSRSIPKSVCVTEAEQLDISPAVSKFVSRSISQELRLSTKLGWIGQ